MEPCHNCRCPDRDSNRAAPEYKFSLKPGSMWPMQATRRTHTHTRTHAHTYSRAHTHTHARAHTHIRARARAHTHTLTHILYSMLFCDMSGVYIMCYCATLWYSKCLVLYWCAAQCYSRCLYLVLVCCSVIFQVFVSCTGVLLCDIPDLYILYWCSALWYSRCLYLVVVWCCDIPGVCILYWCAALWYSRCIYLVLMCCSTNILITFEFMLMFVSKSSLLSNFIFLLCLLSWHCSF